MKASHLKLSGFIARQLCASSFTWCISNTVLIWNSFKCVQYVWYNTQLLKCATIPAVSRLQPCKVPWGHTNTARLTEGTTSITKTELNPSAQRCLMRFFTGGICFLNRAFRCLVTWHNTPIHNILWTAPQLSISQKALGTLPEDGNVMPKHVEATKHN
jgi:hypothetical protein